MPRRRSTLSTIGITGAASRGPTAWAVRASRSCGSSTSGAPGWTMTPSAPTAPGRYTGRRPQGLLSRQGALPAAGEQGLQLFNGLRVPRVAGEILELLRIG